MVYKSQLIGYKKPTDHQNLSVFQLPYEKEPFPVRFFLSLYYRELVFVSAERNTANLHIIGYRKRASAHRNGIGKRFCNHTEIKRYSALHSVIAVAPAAGKKRAGHIYLARAHHRDPAGVPLAENELCMCNAAVLAHTLIVLDGKFVAVFRKQSFAQNVHHHRLGIKRYVSLILLRGNADFNFFN